MSRPRKPKLKVSPSQMYLDFLTDHPEGKQLVSVYRDLNRYIEQLEQKKKLPIYQLCPRGSVLEHVVDMTIAETDLPPSLTYHAAITMLGASLTQHGFVTVLPDGKRLSPNIWTIALAPSGAGKTWCRDNIAEPVIGESTALVSIPETITAAALFHYLITTGLSPEEESALQPAERERLLRRRRSGLLCRDEVGEFMRQLNRSEIYAELKDILLRAYDGKPVKRATRKDGEKETGPISISFYGTAPNNTFFASLKEVDFLNGFFQRFLLVLADDRPDHRVSWYTTYGKQAVAEAFIKTWTDTLAGPRDYYVTDKAFAVFDAWFHKSFQHDSESYIRRYAFSAFKYALILKAITQPDGQIDAAIVDKALGIVDRHLNDFFTAMRDYSTVSEWHIMYTKIEKFLEIHREARRSDLRAGVRGIGTPKELDAWLGAIAEARTDDVGQHAARLLKKR